MEIVNLGGGYDWPVHCPFCGSPSDKDGEILGCKHLLYVFGVGEFFFRSDRLNKAANLEAYSDWGDDLPTAFIMERGGGEKICASIDAFNHIQFRIEYPNDVGLVGFAWLDEDFES